jgi:hypothetical protein
MSKSVEDRYDKERGGRGERGGEEKRAVSEQKNTVK